MINIDRFLAEQIEHDELHSRVVIGNAIPAPGVIYFGFVAHRGAPPCGPCAIAIAHFEQNKIALDFIQYFTSAVDAVCDLQRFNVGTCEGAIVIGADFDEDAGAIAAASLICSLRSRKLH